KVDINKAEGAPGVLCVLTGTDAKLDNVGSIVPGFMPEDMGGPKGYRSNRPILSADKVRCVGDRVAFVVAESAAEARDAAELIEVDYEILPAAINVEDAVKDGAPKVWDDCPTGNISCGVMFGSKDTADAAFAKAKHKVALKLYNQRVAGNPMEPRTSI